MRNKKLLGRLGWVIQQMHTEAAKRDAAVFRAESATEGNPFKILVFTMLSARTRDEKTIRAVEKVFAIAKTPREIRSLGSLKLEKLLYGVGFYRVKTKNLLKICEMLVANGDRVPDSLDGLLQLPGIGRKTANIILSRAFGKAALGVDVHVHRISNRLGLVKTKKPEDTEKELTKIIPSKYLRMFNRSFVAFGQTICSPIKPKCDICPLNQLCYRVGVKEPCKECAFGVKS
ncbi:endonuclease III [Candidatus Micrarchaeota archaeon]|nr:endonuclease III [Candidatus Micrarchaeota archaeon]